MSLVPPAGPRLSLKEYPLRVLLVDDQRIVGEAVRRMLSGHVPEIEFRLCLDAAAALATAIEFSPTLILQDLIMPGADGLNLVRAYRENRGHAENPHHCSLIERRGSDQGGLICCRRQ